MRRWGSNQGREACRCFVNFGLLLSIWISIQSYHCLSRKPTLTMQCGLKGFVKIVFFKLPSLLSFRHIWFFFCFFMKIMFVVCMVVLIGRRSDTGLPWNEYFRFKYSFCVDSIFCSGLAVDTTSTFCDVMLVKFDSDKRSTISAS